MPKDCAFSFSVERPSAAGPTAMPLWCLPFGHGRRVAPLLSEKAPPAALVVLQPAHAAAEAVAAVDSTPLVSSRAAARMAQVRVVLRSSLGRQKISDHAHLLA